MDFPQSKLHLEIKTGSTLEGGCYVTVIFFFLNHISGGEPLSHRVAAHASVGQRGSRLKPSCKATCCSESSAIIIRLSCLILYGIVSFQGKKRPKQKPVASVQSEEVELKESVALGQEPPRPAVRKRMRQRHKVGMETVRSQKVRNVSPLCVVKGIVSWHVRTTFSTVLRPSFTNSYSLDSAGSGNAYITIYKTISSTNSDGFSFLYI